MDATAQNSSPETQFMPPSREQTEQLVEELEKKGIDVERLEQMIQTTGEKEKLVTEMGKTLRVDAAQVNVPKLAEHLKRYKIESRIKADWTKSEVAKEGGGLLNRGWNWVKKHPYMTLGIVAGILGIAAAAYYSGAAGAAYEYVKVQVGKMMTAAGIGKAAAAGKEAVGAASEAAQGAAGAAGEALQNALPAMPEVPMAPTPAAPLPSALPSVDEATSILDALGRRG